MTALAYASGMLSGMWLAAHGQRARYPRWSLEWWAAGAVWLGGSVFVALAPYVAVVAVLRWAR